MPTPITINVNFIDLTGSTVIGYMTAAIVSPSGVYDLYVATTGMIAPKTVTSGMGTSVSVQVWGNDVVIDMVDGAKDTYYTVNLFEANNTLIWSAAYLFTGAGPINLVGFPSLTILPGPPAAPIIVTAPPTPPAGNDTDVQVNSGGLFYGDGNFTYDHVTGKVAIKSKGNSNITLTLNPFSTSVAQPILYVEDDNGAGSPFTIGLVTIRATGNLGCLTVENPSQASNAINIANTTALAIAQAGIRVSDGGALQLTSFTGSATSFLNISRNTVQFIAATGATGGSLSLVASTGGTTFAAGVDSGIVTEYGTVNTVNNGVPAQVAAVNQASLSAAVGATTLYAVPATTTGLYRVNWNAKVVTPDGASSTLGGLTITYTDPDSTVQTISAAATTAAGAIALTATGNVTTTVLHGLPLFINCKASTNIQYAMAYTSGTAGAMHYNLHITLEGL